MNDTSRFHVSMAAVRGGSKHNAKIAIKRQELLATLDHAIKKACVLFQLLVSLISQEYALKYGKDPDDCYALPTFEDWKPKDCPPIAASGHKTEEFFVN